MNESHHHGQTGEKAQDQHADEAGATDHAHPSSGMGTHGMLMIGSDPIYLSHLPMFMSPHNMQAVLEVVLTKGGRRVRRREVERAKSTARVCTFEPEEFALSELISDPPARTSFSGTVFRGHFERGGEPVIEDIEAKVQRIVVFEELSLDASDASRGELEYLCFGTPGNLFLAHHITSRPDFDQLLAVGLDDADLAQMAFPVGKPVLITGRDNDLESRIRDGETLDASFFQSIGPGGRHGFTTQLRVDSEIYLEVDELS